MGKSMLILCTHRSVRSIFEKIIILNFNFSFICVHFSGKGYDYSVDLWAFGILLFEMYEVSVIACIKEDDNRFQFGQQ